MDGLGGFGSLEKTANMFKKTAANQIKQTVQATTQQIGINGKLSQNTQSSEQNLQTSNSISPSEGIEEEISRQNKSLAGSLSQPSNSPLSASRPTSDQTKEETKITQLQKELKSYVHEAFDIKPKEILQKREEEYKKYQEETSEEKKITDIQMQKKSQEFESIILKNRKTGGGELGKATG